MNKSFINLAIFGIADPNSTRVIPVAVLMLVLNVT